MGKSGLNNIYWTGGTSKSTSFTYYNNTKDNKSGKSFMFDVP